MKRKAQLEIVSIPLSKMVFKNFQRMSFIQVLRMLLILMCFISFSSGTTAVSLEDRFLKLEAKVYQLEEKNIRQEEKNIQLEETNIQLEGKVTELEIKVKEQETILTSLLQANELPTSSVGGSKLFSNKRQTAIQSSGKSGIPRTCQELRAADPSLPSGMQWIDPDGQGVGDDPINVYCNMTTGITNKNSD